MAFAKEKAWAHLSLEQPAVVGGPIWVRVDMNGGLSHSVRYPFNVDPDNFGRFSFDVVSDGRPVKRFVPPGRNQFSFPSMGLFGGSIAPASAKQNRVPLHIAYRLSTPGTYSIRLRIAELNSKEWPVISDWLSFELRPASMSATSQLDALLSSAPSDDGEAVGDYIPSLLACSGASVVNAIANYLHHPSRVVRQFAVQSLGYLGGPALHDGVMKAMRALGPTQEMAYAISPHPDVFGPSKDELAELAVKAVSSDTAAGVTLLRFLRYDDQWGYPADTKREMDAAVEQIADKVVASDDEAARNALAMYAGGASDDTSRKVLRRLAESEGAREQALIALAWRGNPGDLPFLRERLLTGDKAAISLPYQFINHYGAQGLGVVEEALQRSPSMEVRWACARELTILDRPEAFRFYLENLNWNSGRRGEILQLMRDHVKGAKELTDEALPSFLKLRARNEK